MKFSKNGYNGGGGGGGGGEIFFEKGGGGGGGGGDGKFLLEVGGAPEMEGWLEGC